MLMEPNGRYLCIVPAREAASGGLGDRVFLPFEGDGTLAIILSKEFLLAEDKKIKDPTILHQIAGSAGQTADGHCWCRTTTVGRLQASVLGKDSTHGWVG